MVIGVSLWECKELINEIRRVKNSLKVGDSLPAAE
jgi:hypothetical protein